MAVPGTTLNQALSGGPSHLVGSFLDKKTIFRFLAVQKNGPLTEAALRYIHIIERSYSPGTVRLLKGLHISLASLPSISPQRIHELSIARLTRDPSLNSDEAVLSEDLGLMPHPMMRSNQADVAQLMHSAYPATPETEGEAEDSIPQQDGMVAVHLETHNRRGNHWPAKLLISGPDDQDGFPHMELTYCGPLTADVSQDEMLAMLAGDHPALRMVSVDPREAAPRGRLRAARQAITQSVTQIGRQVQTQVQRAIASAAALNCLRHA